MLVNPQYTPTAAAKDIRYLTREHAFFPTGVILTYYWPSSFCIKTANFQLYILGWDPGERPVPLKFELCLDF